jgi:predicted AAA+ superfamily ATPase
VEDFYFASHTLVDLANEFVQNGGKHLIIDEIHKYQNWSQELKLIYDYHPDLQVIFTGSSILDIKKGSADLSRRALMYHLQGLSFREYLKLKHDIHIEKLSLNEIIKGEVEVKIGDYSLPLFKEYLQYGYYPFFMEGDFDMRLNQIVNQTLESDIPLFAEMNIATGRKLKHLLAIISQSVPFKPNFSSISNSLSASRNNIADYCLFIEEAGMIQQLRSEIKGIKGLGKVDKIYLDNPNLIYTLSSIESNIENVRETFFLNQTRVSHHVVSSKEADFRIDDNTFEVGGKGKKKKNQNIDHSFVVKDDIEYAFGNTIPLWYFGLLY